MDTKKWWQSKTVIGGTLAAIAGAAALLGAQFPPEAIDETATDVMGIIEAGVALFGGVMAIYGRIKARTEIAK